MPDSMTVISNTSPLFFLYRIRQLELLRLLYDSIIIPDQVAAELLAGGWDTLRNCDFNWIEIKEVRLPEALSLVPDLGMGEASTIALAMETGPSAMIILDDRLARRIANLHRLRITGTAGILMKAKERGLIPAIKPLLNDLVQAGFYLREQHLRDILKLIGE